MTDTGPGRWRTIWRISGMLSAIHSLELRIPTEQMLGKSRQGGFTLHFVPRVG